jgi:hypothetical protein
MRPSVLAVDEHVLSLDAGEPFSRITIFASRPTKRL